MKTIIFIAIMTLIPFSKAPAEIEQGTVRKALASAEFAEGATLHDYILTDQDGKQFHLKDYFGKGKPLQSASFIHHAR